MKSTRLQRSKAVTRNFKGQYLQSPVAFQQLLQGIEQFAELLAVTLGPSKGVVINARSHNEPELLTESGIIAVRVVELPERGENIGAMLIRNMVVSMHDEYGDGAATAAVLMRAILRESTKMLAAGSNPALMRLGIERALAVALQALTEQAQHMVDQELLSSIATSATGDSELGKVLGELFEVLGTEGSLVVEESPAPRIDHEFVTGGRWSGYAAGRIFIPEGSAGLELHNPLIMLVDDEITTLEQVQTALELAVAHPDKPPLLIIAQDIKNQALETLTLNHARGVLTVGPCVLSTPRVTMYEDLEDIAALTNGRVLASTLGYPPERIKPEYFGRARKVRLTRSGLSIIEGDSDGARVRKRISEIRARMAEIGRKSSDWPLLRFRLGRLSGGMGVLKIGAYTEEERTARREKVEKVTVVLEAVMEQGVVPGGGVAFLNCVPAVEAAIAAASDIHADEISGMKAFARALDAPFKQIVHNHGQVHPPVAVMEVRKLGPGYGFDVRSGEYVCMSEAGVVDSLQIVRKALETAAGTAAMALTTDSIVLM